MNTFVGFLQFSHTERQVVLQLVEKKILQNGDKFLCQNKTGALVVAG
jgi:hypothetical protein